MKDWSNPFPGNNHGKSVARLLLYKYAKTAPIQGHAVTLAGTDPEPEVCLMRDYLRWPAHRAWFVDRSRTKEIVAALSAIRSWWPGVNTRCEDLQDLAPSLGAIGFANLDFMGAPLGDGNLNCLKETIPLLLPGGILGVSWLRGRENMAHIPSRRLWKLGIGFQGNERRWAGVIRAIDNLSRGALRFLDRWEYHNNHSPMSMAIFRK